MQIIIKAEKWVETTQEKKSNKLNQRPNIERHKWKKHATKDIFKRGTKRILANSTDWK